LIHWSWKQLRKEMPRSKGSQRDQHRRIDLSEEHDNEARPDRT
jgi:hypothetical protein